jgi:hypothetical protein
MIRLSLLGISIFSKSLQDLSLSKVCSCKGISAEGVDLMPILESGPIPVVLFDKALHVSPANSSIKYVAISQVWSDRLGNPHINSLSCCQLVHINGLVSELYDKSDAAVCFWIDTL